MPDASLNGWNLSKNKGSVTQSDFATRSIASDSQAWAHDNLPKRWVAVLLAFLMPGASLIYLGFTSLGWRVLVITFALELSSTLYFERVPISSASSFLLLVLSLGLSLLALTIFAIVKSIRTPQSAMLSRQGRGHQWLLFVLLFMGSTGADFILSEHIFPRQLNKTYNVPSKSMQPTLDVGTYFLAYNVEPERLKPRDLIVFKASNDTEYVKRLIALPGDLVRVEGNKVWVNGLAEVWRGDPKTPHRFEICFQETCHQAKMSNPAEFHAMRPSFERRLGDDEIFVMGDHRDNSLDSRFAAFERVSVENPVRKVSFTLFPFSKSLGMPE